MGKMQRDKGKRFERLVARMCREATGKGERTLTQQRDSGEAPDVALPGWWLECKHHKRTNIRAAYEQAVDEARRAGSGEAPVAVTKDDGKPILATLDFGLFLEMLASHWEDLETIQRLEAQLAEEEE